MLKHLLPEADVPVLQLSIDRTAEGARHVAVARSLLPLRDEGVMILGSGNVTHNLRDAASRARRKGTSRAEWAERFDADVAAAVRQHDSAFLATARLGEDGRLSHPTADHCLPLLYTIGVSKRGEPVSFPVEGFDLGSLSMRSIVVG